MKIVDGIFIINCELFILTEVNSPFHISHLYSTSSIASQGAIAVLNSNFFVSSMAQIFCLNLIKTCISECHWSKLEVVDCLYIFIVYFIYFFFFI